MMNGVQLADGVRTKKLMVRFRLDNKIVEVVRQESSRWLSHVVIGEVMIFLSKCRSLGLIIVEKRKGQS